MTPWDPEVLGRIRHLQLVSKRVVDSLLQGAHRSLRLGSAVEFADYQEYSPGDSIRHLDWKALARTDRLVIKRFEAETELVCNLVVDVSGDLATGHAEGRGRPPLDGTKFGFAICLAATLAAYLQRHGEPVGLSVIGGDAVVRIPARPGKSHLAQIHRRLAEVRPGGVADLGLRLAELAPGMRRRSLVVVISDFMEETDSWMGALGGFGRRNTDLVGFHMLDRREMDLDFAEPRVLYSPEGGADITLDPVGARQEFREVAAAWRQEVKGAFVRQGGRCYESYSDRPIEEVLRRMIGGRS